MESGLKFGRYTVRSVLGTGAMSIVYEGYDKALDRTVAIKTIRKDLLESDDGEQLRARFRREAQTIANLKHENFFAVFELQEDWDPPYMAMEHIKYRNLSQLIKEGYPFSITQVREIGRGLLSALSYIHSKGLVHRDIKPANLFWEPGEQLKVADFGVAKVSTSTLTQHGMTMGTPSYMAPEQFSGQNEDARADLWAAGVVIYELITRSRCFVGDFEAVRKAVASADVLAFPKAKDFIVGTDFEPILRKALAKQPSARYANAVEFGDALRQARDVDSTNLIDGPATEDDDSPTVLVQAKPSANVVDTLGSITHSPAVRRLWPWIGGGLALLLVGYGIHAVRGNRIDLDAIQSIVKTENCADLDVSHNAGVLSITGFVPSEDSKKQLVERLSKEQGVARVSSRIEIRPWPFCAVVNVLKPVGKTQATWAGSMHVRVQNYAGQLRDGQAIKFELKSPDKPGYIYVDYYQADRSVVHLRPEPGVQEKAESAGSEMTLNAGTVSSPYGDEMVVVMVSSTPMFPQRRAQYESAEQYLPALEEVLKKKSSQDVITDYLFLRTAP